MLDVVGIDSRLFFREAIKKDGSRGTFKSVLGISVRVKDYESFEKSYEDSIRKALESNGFKKEYKCYCFNDIKDHPNIEGILDSFIKNISSSLEKVGIFYTMFSTKKIQRAKVYGRLARNKKLRLAKPTRTYKELVTEHLVNCFPAICAWRLLEYLPKNVQFHIDSYNGHVFEAHEELINSGFARFVYTAGDCTNPVISTSDLLIALLDLRLRKNSMLLTFENLRPTIPELGEKLLAYPISNKHLSKITPLESRPINNVLALKRPIFWIFKGGEDINSGVLKRSATHRNFLDYVAIKGGCVKLFEKKDAEHIREGDYGVYFNSAGEDAIKTYGKIGKKLTKMNIDLHVKSES